MDLNRKELGDHRGTVSSTGLRKHRRAGLEDRRPSILLEMGAAVSRNRETTIVGAGLYRPRASIVIANAFGSRPRGVHARRVWRRHGILGVFFGLSPDGNGAGEAQFLRRARTTSRWRADGRIPPCRRQRRDAGSLAAMPSSPGPWGTRKVLTGPSRRGRQAERGSVAIDEKFEFRRGREDAVAFLTRSPEKRRARGVQATDEDNAIVLEGSRRSSACGRGSTW